MAKANRKLPKEPDPPTSGKKKKPHRYVVDSKGRPAAVSSLHVTTKPAASSRTPRVSDGRVHPVTVRRIARTSATPGVSGVQTAESDDA